MLFGASVMVTKENIDSVVNDDYVQNLRNDGCGVLFFCGIRAYRGGDGAPDAG